MTERIRRWAWQAIVVVAMVALGAAGAGAQSQAVNGTIEGTIKDASGGAAPGVTVTVHNTDTGAERVVVTDANGLYRAPLLPLGTYQVTAELAGFKKQQQTGIPITAGPRRSSTSRWRSAASPRSSRSRRTRRSSIWARSTSAATSTIARSTTCRSSRATRTTSRCSSPASAASRTRSSACPRFSANGSLLRINYQMDGNTNTQKDRAGLRLMPMSEVAIGEVKVTTSGYAPEFGQTMGLVYNAITPSGTNKHARRRQLPLPPHAVQRLSRSSRRSPRALGEQAAGRGQHRDRLGGRPGGQGQGCTTTPGSSAPIAT